MDGGNDIVGNAFDVFISYAHADKIEDSDRSPAEILAKILEAEGYTVWWDRGLLLGKDWARELSVKVGLARKVIALVSPRWLKSEWCGKEEFRAYETPEKLIPILIEDCQLSERLAILQRVKTIGTDFTLIKPLLMASLGPPIRQPTAPPAPSDPDRVQLTLPSAADRLFGRDHELSILDKAWTGGAAPGTAKTNVVVFHAIGGAGKSALVRGFVDGLGEKGYPGAVKVYGWSAYSQGSGENRDTASAEGFIADALRFFGHDLADKPITDPVERGRTLARLVRRQRTLMILDGLEPLQSQPMVNEGRLKDKSLATLITGLADDNPGLLIITSRQELPELATHARVVNRSLENLDDHTGAELLKHLGLHGRERDLETAVRDVGGHALTVNLLGTYLANVCAGDVRQRDTLRLADIIDDMTEQDETARKAKRAKAVMRAYEARFAELAAGASKGAGVAELMLMRIVGLFNRPAEPEAIAAILAAPPIPGLTDAWHALSPQKQRELKGFALARLQKLKLLLGTETAGELTLDAHPVVRQHFGDELANGAPDAFREANDRLYRYYVAVPEKHQPDTLAEMEPLFAAIAHGCAAGRHQEVFDDVYYARVRRPGSSSYIASRLGAFSADLGALAHFFAPPWSTPHPALTVPNQLAALNFAAFALRALGRLRDATEPTAASGLGAADIQDWKNAAAGYSNLSQLRLTLGDVAEAVAAARDSVTYADKSGDALQRFSKRTTLADSLHQAGDVAEADRLFREAEQMQAEDQPGFDKLYSVQGYLFCDLLLGLGKAEEVRVRYAYLVSIRQPSDSLLDRSLEDLLAGRAAHAVALVPSATRDAKRDAARRHLDAAVEGLRKAGGEHHIPRGLLARVAFRRDTGDFAGCEEDLRETYEIAARGGMRLFLTDYYLGWGRMIAAVDPGLTQAENRRNLEVCFREAYTLVQATGYHRRDGELAALRAMLDAS
jgi:tetratricopeptide (TPR) repeat protein